MSIKTYAELLQDFQQRQADNLTGDISPADIREPNIDVIDSVANGNLAYEHLLSGNPHAFLKIDAAAANVVAEPAVVVLSQGQTVPVGYDGQLLWHTDLREFYLWDTDQWEFVGGHPYVDEIQATSLPVTGVGSGPLTGFATALEFGTDPAITMPSNGVIAYLDGSTSTLGARAKLTVSISIENPSNNWSATLAVESNTAGAGWVSFSSWPFSGSRDDTHSLSRQGLGTVSPDTLFRLNFLTNNQNVDITDYALQFEIIDFVNLSSGGTA